MMNECETTPKGDRVPTGGEARNHVHALVPIAATALGIYLCCRMAMPFLSSLVWALALAVIFTPFHRWLEAKLKRRTLAAAAAVLVIGVIVVVPATFVGQRLVLEAAKGAKLVTAKVESGEWRHAIDDRPRLRLLVDKIEREVDLPGTVQALATWLTHVARSIVQGSVVQAIVFLLSFYLLFFFLRDRRLALQSLRSLAPLSTMEMDGLLRRVGDTIRATVYGTLAVSALQGLLGGLMFWWLGLSTPLLWGVVMALLAVVPVLGAFVIWIPAAVFLALSDNWGRALILVVWGTVVVGGIDNLLRPFFVGNLLKLHTVLVFMSVVGGLMLFGPAGLILGPVVLTVTGVLLEIWRHRTAATAGTGGHWGDSGV